MNSKFIWECSCGNIVHEDIMPEDCSYCFKVGEFSRVHEDDLDEKQNEEILRRKRLKAKSLTKSSSGGKNAPKKKKKVN